MKNKVERVCVVDDDPVYQYLAKEEIEYTNMVNNIIFFDNGEKAIAFIAETLEQEQLENLPDIIFLDINMPIMDGWEFLEAYLLLRPRIGKQITIYIVSSSIDIRDVDRARAISAITDYIIKPVSSNRLVSIFSQLLAA